MEKQLLYMETQDAHPKTNALTIKKYFRIKGVYARQILRCKIIRIIIWGIGLFNADSRKGFTLIDTFTPTRTAGARLFAELDSFYNRLRSYHLKPVTTILILPYQRR